MMTRTLRSYLCDGWVVGEGRAATLVDATTEAPLATSSTAGLDFGAALAHGRTVGGPALRALTFAERGAILRQLSEAIVGARKELLPLSMANNGATRSDAKFDVDGASFTLEAYAQLGEELGDRRYLVDGEAVELARSKRYGGLHIKTPRPGVAVHINAFNFPAWGLAEKLAVALLAGMPVVTKPATATALTAAHMAEALVASGALPRGAFQFIAGSPGDLVDHLSWGDVLAFTGSNGLGRQLVTLPHVVAAGVRVNVEADSLNVAVLGPDVEDDAPAFEQLVRDVFRDMTQKTGQKCTAIRRVMVPVEQVDAVVEALTDSIRALKIGDPRADGVRMGPLVSARQRADVLAGLARLSEADGVERVHGAGRPDDLVGVEAGRGFFVEPHLFKAADPAASFAADLVHDEEVFGPAVTVLPYDGSVAAAAALVARGRGGLVASVYSNDRRFVRDLVLELAPWNGRVTIGSDRIATTAPGPGTVMPQLVHGGPGRAGGGEELGLARGMDLYLQRTALQGYRPLLEKLFDGS